MRSEPAWKIIELEFVEQMRKSAQSRGLAFKLAQLREMQEESLKNRIWSVVREQEGKDRHLHVWHFKIKSDASKPYIYDWGVTKKFIEALDSASARAAVPWSLVLLHGGSRFGYCLDANEVRMRREQWVMYGEQYKIMEEPLPAKLYFKTLDDLFTLLGLPGVAGAA